MEQRSSLAPTSGVPTRPLLDGVTVLDLAAVGPAARATSALADFGATVIKVGPVPSSGATPISPPFFVYSGHRGVRRIEIDLKSPLGREAFLALVADADVVVESFRPGVMERLGLGYDALRDANASIILCSTSGFGQQGPLSSWAGHDIDYLAVGGFLATSERRSDGGPPLPGATVADAAAGGLHAALSICAALVGRQATGEGCHLDVAIADGVLWLMSLAIDEHLALGTEPGPGHDLLTGRYACYGVYETADHRWLAVGAIEHKFFVNLVRALGLEQWRDAQMDPDSQDALRLDLARAFARESQAHWIDVLADADTCVAPVFSVAELPTSAHLTERGLLIEATHPTHGTFRQLAPVLAGMLTPEEPVELPDLSYTSTKRLLADAGIDEETIDRWNLERAIA